MLTRLTRRLVTIAALLAMRRVPLLLVLGALALVMVTAAAPADASLATALGIAGVAALILPFVLKLVPAAGKYMIAICVVASLLIAVGSMVASGEIVLDNLRATDLPTLLAIFLSVEGLSQRLYSILIQSPETARAVT